MRGTRLKLAGFVGALVILAQGGEWKGLEEKARYAGRVLTPETLQHRVVLVAEWGVDCPHCSELLTQIDKAVKEREGRPLVFLAVHRQGFDPVRVKAFLAAHPIAASVYEDAGHTDSPESPTLPFLYVVDHKGKVTYSGTNTEETLAAADRALLELPAPGQLASGVVWRHFKKVQTKFVLGKSAEGFFRRIVEQGLRVTNPSVVTEARAILAALDDDRDELGRRIDREIESGDPQALAHLKLYLATWPSRRSAYAARLKALSVPRAKAAASPARVQGNR